MGNGWFQKASQIVLLQNLKMALIWQYALVYVPWHFNNKKQYFQNLSEYKAPTKLHQGIIWEILL